MRYVGSKRRLAKRIHEVVMSLRTDQDVYWEPFVGGCNSFEVIAPEFPHAFGSDVHEDLILMWDAALSGWTPHETITEDEYRAIQNEPPSALRGIVGFGASFGGKWFGGFARPAKSGTAVAYYDRGGTDYASSVRAVQRTIRKLRGTNVTFRHSPYYAGTGSSRHVIYCDPPYASTLGYTGTDDFDHARFWKWCDEQVDNGALVLVSEYTAPDNWECVAEFSHRVSVSLAADRRTTTEKLFIRKEG